jgi:subtilisin family serine protease
MSQFQKHFLRWAGAALITTPVLAQRAIIYETAGGPAYLAGELLVEYREDATAQERANALAAAGVRVERSVRKSRSGQRNGDSRDLDLVAGTANVRSAADILRRQRAVVAAEPNWIYQHQEVSNDPLFSTLWGLSSAGFGSGAQSVWANGVIGSSTVVVGIIDEGIDISHPDLSANIWVNPYDPVDGIDNDGNGYVDDVNGWDFAGNTRAVYSTGADTHGTHVAGTIGAVGGNAIGVVGVNWNVQMISGKFLTPTGGTTADAIEAVDYFAGLKQRHPDLDLVALNNSWGGGGYSGLLHAAIIRAANQGILFIAAAGNGDALGRAINNDATASYPANYDTTVAPTGITPAVPASTYNSVVAVTSINSAGAKSTWANFGANRVHIAAPGEGINSTYPAASYATISGTSMATPHVTGAVALLASQDPTLEPTELRKRLLASATPTTSVATTTRTGGRLNLPGMLSPVDATSLPTTPIGVRAAIVSSRISLSWVPAIAAASYTIQRSTSATGTFTAIGQVANESFTDPTAVAGTQYFYRVSAVNSNGASTGSAVVNATIPAVAPTAPSGLTATVAAATPTTVRLGWTDRSTNETGFGIEISTNNRNWTAVGTAAANATTINVNGLARSTRYYFRIRALGSGGLNSAYTSSVQIRTL